MNIIIFIVLEKVIIMKIKLDSLYITEYCHSDKRKYRFIKEVGEDPLINQFVSYHIDNHLENSENLNDLEIGPAYIIADQRKLVGLIRLANLDFDGTLELHYAVHPDYRRQHYGTKILAEVSKYVFKNVQDVKMIELYIKEINKGSLKCATNAGFLFDRDLTPLSNNYSVKVFNKRR